MYIRSEDSEGETAQRYKPPLSLFVLFRDIVLFLLCTLLSVTETLVDSDTINFARVRVTDGLRESEGAFLRMAEHAARRTLTKLGMSLSAQQRLYWA